MKKIEGRTTMSTHGVIGFLFSDGEGGNFFIVPHLIESVELLESPSFLGWMYRRELAKKTETQYAWG